jgi:hypothetical protein
MGAGCGIPSPFINRRASAAQFWKIAQTDGDPFEFGVLTDRPSLFKSETSGIPRGIPACYPQIRVGRNLGQAVHREALS